MTDDTRLRTSELARDFDPAPYYDDIRICLDASLEQPWIGIPALRSLLERACKELTAGVDRQFSGLFPLMTYVFDALLVPATLREELHGLRKLGNHQLHNVHASTDEELRAGSRALCRFLEEISGRSAPISLLSRTDTDHRLSRPRSSGSASLLVDVTAVVVDKGGGGRLEDGTPFATLFCRFEDDESASGNLATLRCVEPHHILIRQVWPSSVLRFSSLTVVDADQHVYRTNSRTLAILEPDYLVDAVDIASCFGHQGQAPQEYLVSQLGYDQPNWKATVGTIINSLFDALLLLPQDGLDEADIDSLIREASRHLTLAFFLHGPELRQRILHDVRDQYPHLVAAVRRLRKNTPLLSIEPFFMSPRHGLQGRLDVLLEDPATGTRHVVELKSGKAPNSGVWKNHEAQVACYALLLNWVYGRWSGSSHVLYSREARHAFRAVPAQSRLNERDLLQVRNAIIATEHRLTQDAASLILGLREEHLDSLNPFSRTRAEDLISAFGGADPLEQAYLSLHLGLAAREHWRDKVGGGSQDSGYGMASLWLLNPEEKRRQFGLVAPMELTTLEKVREEILLRFRHETRDANFRPDDFVLLYPWQEPHGGDPTRHLILKGILREYGNGELSLFLISRQTDRSHFEKYSFWAMEHDTLWSTYRYSLQSMTTFLEAPPERRALLLGRRAPARPDGDEAEEDGSVDAMIARACAAPEYFLIVGPPGTGKTRHALAGIVERLGTEPEGRIVVLAYTNRAVDEIRDALRGRQLRALDLRRDVKDLDSEEDLNTLLAEHRILISTVFSFLRDSRYLLSHLSISAIVVDEASQLLDIHLVGLLSLPCRFILIGDDRQLPAVVQQNEIQTRAPEILHPLGIHDARCSLFERLLATCEREGWHWAWGMLTRQGRMHEDLAHYVNTRYYEGRLTVREKWQTRIDRTWKSTSPDPLEAALARSRLLFFSLPPEPQPYAHEGQARLLLRILHTMERKRGTELRPEDIGIITPYRVQIARIRALLPPAWKGILVDTVERYQGSERDIILVSLPINHLGALATLSVPSITHPHVDRKLNVTLTRARQRLILTGCADILEHNPWYRDLLENLRARNAVIEGADRFLQEDNDVR